MLLHFELSTFHLLSLWLHPLERLMLVRVNELSITNR
jgi:hypothetical protein